MNYGQPQLLVSLCRLYKLQRHLMLFEVGLWIVRVAFFRVSPILLFRD